METKQTLGPSTIASLQALIRVNFDSQKEFNTAAESISDSAIAMLFRQIGQDRAANATELRREVAQNYEAPEDDGSVLGAAHRWWLSARGALSGGDDYAVLAEAERGEDAIKRKYEDILKETAGSAMNDVLMRQYARVKSQHDRIRDLRDARAKH